MKIALIEPFYTSSHKQWLDNVERHLPYEFTLFTLPGRHWKWRMHGAAVTLAQEFLNHPETFDGIVASDMLDLSTFLGLTKSKVKDCLVVLYMHENQLTYPWSPKDEDVRLKRDNHYAFINYTSCLTADKVCFNSIYHKDSFLMALPNFLKQFPDHRNEETIKYIREKSEVLYLLLDLPEAEIKKAKNPHEPTLLWNHRWEYDKNPQGFYNILCALKEQDFAFRLIILGESYTIYPKVFDVIKEEFSKELIHWGYAEDKVAYYELIQQADVLPVTSYQDFFGISVVEAIASGVKPLVPNRLAYPEYVDKENIYHSQDELFRKITDHESLPVPDVSRFSIESLKAEYNQFFETVFLND